MKQNIFFDDIIEVTTDLVLEYKEKKLPKILKQLLMYRKSKDIYKILDKYKDSYCIFDLSIIHQYAMLVYHQFIPEHCYGCITSIIMSDIEEYGRYRMGRMVSITIEINGVIYDIHYKTNDRLMDITITYEDEDGNIDTYNTTCNRLRMSQRNSIYQYDMYLTVLNQTLLKESVSFFKLYIKEQLKLAL